LAVGGDPNFFFDLFYLAKLRLHTENQLCIMLGSALKVCVGGGVESEFSDRFGLGWPWPSRTTFPVKQVCQPQSNQPVLMSRSASVLLRLFTHFKSLFVKRSNEIIQQLLVSYYFEEEE
jgi:hypothetical protein